MTLIAFSFLFVLRRCRGYRPRAPRCDAAGFLDG
jgi:hypothetical protein